MNYPLISEYLESIMSAEDNFEELTNLRLVLGDDGQPVMTSGNFAVVFKMRDVETGKFYALKCFTKEQKGRAEAYHQIADALKDVDSPYLVSLRYLDKELFVDTEQTAETEFPVLLMDWVEGKTLDKYLRENLDDKYALEMLAYRFCQLAQWLIPQSFAHGDLKPDNILVREDGTLVLVDYDGMYVPAMKGQRARELGSPDFRHPQRTENDFDEHIDDFPLASILLSLKSISISPLLLEEFGEENRLLLSENDYRDITNSPLVSILLYLLSNKDLALTYSIFISSIIHFGLDNGFISAIMELNYEKSYSGSYSRIVSYNNNGIKDESDVVYNEDGKMLIRGYNLYEPYEIHSDTELIHDKAFSGEYYWDGSGWNEVEKIIIPKGIKYIGRNPFAFCFVHIICKSPNYVLENNTLYTVDKKLLIGYYGYKNETFDVPEGVETIGDYAFAGRGLKFIKLPSTVKVIGDFAFLGCQLLEKIEMSTSIKHIGQGAFTDCKKLQNLKLPNGLLSIGSFAFSYCSSIQSINVPSTVISIGRNPFLYDRQLNLYCDSYLYEVENKTLYTKGKKLIVSCLSRELSFQIPIEVSHIGSHAFWGCPFKSIYIHDNILHIGEDAFDGCYYEAYPYGYSMKLLVSKGRGEWLRKLVPNKMVIKETDDV